MEVIKSISLTRDEARFIYDLMEVSQVTGAAPILVALSVVNKINSNFAFDPDFNVKQQDAKPTPVAPKDKEMLVKFLNRVTAQGKDELFEMSQLINQPILELPSENGEVEILESEEV